MDTCTNLIACVAEYGALFLDFGFAIIASASAIAALTPTPADDHLLAKAYRFLDMLALNFGYAKDRPGRSKGGRFVAR